MQTIHLVQLAEIYGKHRRLKLSTVSTYSNRDGKFFDALKSGAGCTVKTATRLAEWFSDHWPADLDWPTDIPRPEQKKEVA